MPSQWYTPTLPMVLSILCTANAVYGSPASPLSLIPRDDHGHHHGAPLLELNETAILTNHAPTPPSYWSIDIDRLDPSISGHPTLMIFHVALMCLAFFVILPMAIAMRSVRHSWRPLVIMTFYGFAALGWGAGALYKKVTPNMYEGSSHAPHGILLLLLTFALSLFDVLLFIQRLLTYIRSGEKFVPKSFWKTVVLNKEEHLPKGAEYAELMIDNPEEVEFTIRDACGKIDGEEPQVLHKAARRSEEGQHFDQQDVEWANVHRHTRRYSGSVASEQTLFHPSSRDLDDDLYISSRHAASKQSLFIRVRTGILATLERAFIFAAWGLLLTGIVTYTGICRRYYINGCLAHLIKGSIFWCYGLVTFARFLGSFAELGWAWNRTFTGYPSAEFVESLLIFAYGITNTWMERFGANPGDPFTTKQIQHISIAVMFWFAGLAGMGLESKRLRRWLASHRDARIAHQTVEPPSNISAFNPFPALVMGVTGAAMSAHAQTYLFQVKIHALWGSALVGFTILRSLTYCLLWVSPPRSAVPSRPPTEALASFCLACGGLLFILSDEEITFAAMRRGRDDVMMFLNVVVAITCFAFCWILSIVAFKAWLKARAFN